MRLSELPARLIEQTITVWRRRLIVGAIAAVCGIAVVVHGIEAARLALEPLAGRVGARLILMAIFGLVIVAAVMWLRRQERQAASHKAEQPFGGTERVATIAEAIDLGYAMGREFWHGSKPSAPEPANDQHASPQGAGSEAEAASKRR